MAAVITLRVTFKYLSQSCLNRTPKKKKHEPQKTKTVKRLISLAGSSTNKILADDIIFVRGRDQLVQMIGSTAGEKENSRCVFFVI